MNEAKQHSVAVMHFAGGVEVICRNLVETNRRLINTSPSLVSSIMQYFGSSRPDANNGRRLAVYSDASADTAVQNFALLGQQSYDAVLYFAVVCRLQKFCQFMTSSISLMLHDSVCKLFTLNRSSQEGENHLTQIYVENGFQNGVCAVFRCHQSNQFCHVCSSSLLGTGLTLISSTQSNSRKMGHFNRVVCKREINSVLASYC